MCWLCCCRQSQNGHHSDHRGLSKSLKIDHALAISRRRRTFRPPKPPMWPSNVLGQWRQRRAAPPLCQVAGGRTAARRWHKEAGPAEGGQAASGIPHCRGEGVPWSLCVGDCPIRWDADVALRDEQSLPGKNGKRLHQGNDGFLTLRRARAGFDGGAILSPQRLQRRGSEPSRSEPHLKVIVQCQLQRDLRCSWPHTLPCSVSSSWLVEPVLPSTVHPTSRGRRMPLRGRVRVVYGPGSIRRRVPRTCERVGM